MALRSEARIRRDITVRRRIAAAGGTGEFGRSAAATAQRSLGSLQAELDEVGSGLDWSIDGPGVTGHALAFRILAPYADALGRTFRHTTRDIMHIDGIRPIAGVKLTDLVEPVAAPFKGSFGLRISGSQAPQQMSLFGSLFDQAAERVVALVEASTAIDPGPAIVTHLGGLRTNTLGALGALCELTVETGHYSSVRWRGGRPIEFHAREAEVLAETLDAASVEDYDIIVQAELESGSRDSGRFHLIERDGEKRSFRGKPHPDAQVSLAGIPVGAMVEAELVVVETDSPLLDQPKLTYALKSIRKLPD
jgi:hypothetical protein